MLLKHKKNGAGMALVTEAVRNKFCDTEKLLGGRMSFPETELFRDEGVVSGKKSIDPLIKKYGQPAFRALEAKR